MGGAYALMAFLGAIALGLLGLADSGYRRLGTAANPAVIVPGLIGAALAILTLMYHGYARRLVADADAEDARRAQFPDQPWKWRKECQAPYLETDTGSSAAGLWFFAVVWNAISFPATWIVLHDPHAPKAAWFIFLFPVVGVGVLWGAIYQTIRWRKFGRPRFVPTALPGVIGGFLGGVIEVPARVVPEADGRLSLKCVRRVSTGSGKNRRTSETVLWEHEEQIARDKWITGTGGTRIPVLFYIPPGNPATDDANRDNEVVWRLAASAAVPGVDFAVRFKVPVYVTGETAPAPAAGAPLLEEYSAPAMDAAALAKCGVQQTGDTFTFGASHLPGTKAVTGVLTLGLFSLLVWFWGRDIPGVVWGFTLFFGLIIALFTSSVWFSRYDLLIEASDVVVSKPRPWGTTVTRVPRAEVQSVKLDRAMSSGDNQFYGLSLVGPPGAASAAPAPAGEPFAVRKLRFQLAQLEKQGGLTPEKRRELGDAIAAELRAVPKFLVKFAAYIPGQTKAEAIGALVLEAIRGKG